MYTKLFLYSNSVGLEGFFTNTSFILLFFTMLSFWTSTAFKDLKLKIPFFPSSSLSFSSFLMILSNFSLMSLLILRWINSGHFPLSNLYESLMFLAWSSTCLHFILLNMAVINVGSYTLEESFIGCITAPCSLLMNAYATFSLPQEMQQISPLVPALQSNWLMMHVTVMIISYSALILGSLLSLAFLILTLDWSLFKKPILSYPAHLGRWKESSTESLQASDTDRQERKKTGLKIAENLDNYSYRILGIGFPFLTIGILSGAVWANEAWGSYWSWDPKETWALLTWFVYAIYLHTRITKGWQGKKPAIIASLGFIFVWICFLGVNLIGEGLHSYGWFSA